MPKGMHNAWRNRGGVDEYAAPFGGSMKGGNSEVPRAGAHSDTKAASGHSRKGKGAKKSYPGY